MVISSIISNMWAILEESVDNSSWNSFIEFSLNNLKQKSTKTLNKEKYYRLRLFTSTINTYDNLTIKLKLEPGTQATPWSPYGMGCVNEKIQTRNLLDNIIENQTLNGVQFTLNDDKSETLNGTATSNIYKTINESSLPEGNYKIIGGISNNIYLGVFEFLNGVQQPNRWYDTGRGNTFQARKGYIYRIQIVIVQNTSISNETIYPMLYPSSIEDTSYVPHEEQNISVPTRLPMVGEEDYFDWENEEEVHGWKKLTLDGTEEFYKNTYATSGDFTAFQLVKVINNIALKNTGVVGYMSNFFECVVASLYNAPSQHLVQMNDKTLLIKVKNDIADNVPDLKSWLAEKYANGTPVIIYYRLVTPERVHFTQEQKRAKEDLEEAYSYLGGTYISSEDEVKARIKVSGLRDLNSLQTDISNVKQAIVALGGVV